MDTVESTRSRVFVPKLVGLGDDDDEPSLASQCFGSLATGAAGEVGSAGVGWVMNSILGGDGPSGSDLTGIQASLTQLNSEMNTVIADLANIQQQLADLAETDTWNNRAGGVDTAQMRIQSDLETLTTLTPGSSTASAKDIVDWWVGNGLTTLNTIHAAMVSGSLIAQPGEYGLLRIYSDKCVEACRNGGFTRRSFAPGGPLDLNYTDLQNYFTSLVALEVQGMTLLTNALNAKNETATAQRQLILFQQNVAAQCEEFLWSAESYVVGVCGDDSLLDLFRGANGNCAPLRRADATVDQYIYPAAPATGPVPAALACTFRTRVWGGTSTDGSLNTTSFVALQSAASGTPVGQEPGTGLAVQLVSSGGTTVAPTTSVHTVFPAFGTKQWSLFRHSFVNPAADSYTLAPPLNAPTGQVNTLIDSYSGTSFVYGATIALPPLAWWLGPAPDRHQVQLTTRTLLHSDSTGSQNVSTMHDFTRTGFTLEAWVRLSSAGGMAVGVVLTGESPTGEGGTAAFNLNFANWGVNGHLTVQARDGGYRNLTTSGSQQGTLGDGGWHHVAAVLDRGSGSITLYLDGQPLQASSEAGTISNWGGQGGIHPGYGSDWSWSGGYVAIASPIQDAEGGSVYTTWPGMAGDVSEVRFWNTARGVSDIAGMMRRRATGTESGIAAVWNLDTGGIGDGVDGITVPWGAGVSVGVMTSDWLSLPGGEAWATNPSS
jgi:hypothetical protein